MKEPEMMGKRKMLLISAGEQIPWLLLPMGTLSLKGWQNS